MVMTYTGNGSSLELCTDTCTGCGICLDVCPHQVLAPVSPGTARKVQVVARDRCMECGACSRNCPFGAIRVKSGVGCVAAIINGMRMGSAPSCDCSKGDSCC